MMFEELWASRRAVSWRWMSVGRHDALSLTMFEEFWTSRCALSCCLKGFGRNRALSDDVWGVVGVTVRSHDV